MSNVALFRGVTEVTVPELVPEPEPLDPAIVDVLMRYQDLGVEFKRQHSHTLNFDLQLEIAELHRLTDQILN